MVEPPRLTRATRISQASGVGRPNRRRVKGENTMNVGEVNDAVSTVSIPTGRIIWSNPATTPARLHRLVKIHLGENAEKPAWVIASVSEIVAVLCTQIHQIIHAGDCLILVTIGELDAVDLDLAVGLCGGTFDPNDQLSV